MKQVPVLGEEREFRAHHRADFPLEGQIFIHDDVEALTQLRHGIFAGFLNEIIAVAEIGNLASALALIIEGGIGAIWYPLFVSLVLLLSHLVLRNRVAAIGLTIVAFAFFGDFAEGLEWLLFGAALVASSILVLTIVRWGLLAGAAATYTVGVFFEAPLVMDPSSWLFPFTLLFLLPLVVLIGTGFFLALGKQPLFSEAVLED